MWRRVWFISMIELSHSTCIWWLYRRKVSQLWGMQRDFSDELPDRDGVRTLEADAIWLSYTVWFIWSILFAIFAIYCLVSLVRCVLFDLLQAEPGEHTWMFFLLAPKWVKMRPTDAYYTVHPRSQARSKDALYNSNIFKYILIKNNWCNTNAWYNS